MTILKLIWDIFIKCYNNNNNNNNVIIIIIIIIIIINVQNRSLYAS